MIHLKERIKLMKFLNLKKFLFLVIINFLGSSAYAGWLDLNMPQGATDISQEVYSLHMLILYICCIIGVVVFGYYGLAY